MTDAKIISDLLALPSKRRAKIAGALIRSLDDEEVAQGEVDAAWAKEIEHRVAQIRNGTAKLIPGDVFAASLRRKIKSVRRRAR